MHTPETNSSNRSAFHACLLGSLSVAEITGDCLTLKGTLLSDDAFKGGPFEVSDYPNCFLPLDKRVGFLDFIVDEQSGWTIPQEKLSDAGFLIVAREAAEKAGQEIMPTSAEPIVMYNQLYVPDPFEHPTLLALYRHLSNIDQNQ